MFISLYHSLALFVPYNKKNQINNLTLSNRKMRILSYIIIYFEALAANFQFADCTA